MQTFEEWAEGYALDDRGGRRYDCHIAWNAALVAANERIRELEAEAKMPGKCARAIAPLMEDLAAERAVSDRLLEALKKSADEIGYIAFKCERDTTTLKPSRELLAEVEAMRKERE